VMTVVRGTCVRRTNAIVRLRKDASTATMWPNRLGDDRNVGSLGELVNKVATGTKRQRFGDTRDCEFSLGDARSKQHDREGVVVLSRPPAKAVGGARSVVKGHGPGDRIRVLRRIAFDQLPVGDLDATKPGPVERDEPEVARRCDLAPNPAVDLAAEDPPIRAADGHFVKDGL
jgi:hypothetical protein